MLDTPPVGKSATSANHDTPAPTTGTPDGYAATAQVPTRRSRFCPVNKDAPCAACGRARRCFVFTDADTGEPLAANCYRVPSEREQTDRQGVPYWQHDPQPGQPVAPPIASRAAAPADPLSFDDLHRAYAALGRALSLRSGDARDLRKRGLTHEAAPSLTLLGYATLDWDHSGPARRVMRDLGLTEAYRLLPRVPGFLAPTGKDIDLWEDWRVCGLPGLLVPVRDAEGRIRGYQVRVRPRYVRDGGKYRWLTSATDGGPGPSYFCHVPHPTIRPSDCSTVRLTEGPLKADVATALGGVLTLGVPGVGSWREFLPVVAELGAATVRLAWDADACRKREVARTLRDLADACLGAGLAVELELWDAADGKGIDDVLAAGKGDRVRLVAGEQAVRVEVARVVAEAEAADPLPEVAQGAAQKVGRRSRRAFDSRGFAARFAAMAAAEEARSERIARLSIVPVLTPEQAAEQERKEEEQRQLEGAACGALGEIEERIREAWARKPMRKESCRNGHLKRFRNKVDPREGGFVGRTVCGTRGCPHCACRMKARDQRQAADCCIRCVGPQGVPGRKSGAMTDEGRKLPFRSTPIYRKVVDDEREKDQAIKRLRDRHARQHGIEQPGYLWGKVENGRFAILTEVPIPGAQQLTPADAARAAALLISEAECAKNAYRFGGRWVLQKAEQEYVCLPWNATVEEAQEVLEAHGADVRVRRGQDSAIPDGDSEDPSDSERTVFTLMSYSYPEDMPLETVLACERALRALNDSPALSDDDIATLAGRPRKWRPAAPAEPDVIDVAAPS